MHLYFFPQQIPKAVLPLSPTLSTYLLSEYVQREMGEDGQQRFRLRMLFHQMGDSSTQRTCVTLHAFRETEEQKASCITQVRRRVNRVHPIRGLIQTGISFDIHSCDFCFSASFGSLCGHSNAAGQLVHGSAQEQITSRIAHQVTQQCSPSQPSPETQVAFRGTPFQQVCPPLDIDFRSLRA